MSDPTFSDIDYENKMAWVWTTLKFMEIHPIVIMKTSLFDKKQSQVQIQWDHSALPNVFLPTMTGSEAIQTYKSYPEEASSCTLYQFYKLFLWLINDDS